MAPNEPGTSRKPGKQRKRQANASHQQRRKMMSAHLSEDLMLEFDRRSMPVREGDTVEILRGDFKGHEAEVLGVDRARIQLEVDGVTNRRADGTQIPRPIHPSNVRLTDLHLTDPKRRAAIERKGVEVEAPPEPEEDEEQDLEDETTERDEDEEDGADEAEPVDEPTSGTDPAPEPVDEDAPPPATTDPDLAGDVEGIADEEKTTEKEGSA